MIKGAEMIMEMVFSIGRLGMVSEMSDDVMQIDL